MSRTATIIISVDPDDNPTITDLSAWLQNQAVRSDDRISGTAGNLMPMGDSLAADAWGGHKTPSTGLWGGVANHLNLEQFTAQLATLAWKHPDHVQALIKDEADPWFRLYMIRGGTLTQHAPVPEPDQTELAW